MSSAFTPSAIAGAKRHCIAGGIAVVAVVILTAMAAGPAATAFALAASVAGFGVGSAAMFLTLADHATERAPTPWGHHPDNDDYHEGKL